MVPLWTDALGTGNELPPSPVLWEHKVKYPVGQCHCPIQVLHQSPFLPRVPLGFSAVLSDFCWQVLPKAT